MNPVLFEAQGVAVKLDACFCVFSFERLRPACPFVGYRSCPLGCRWAGIAAGSVRRVHKFPPVSGRDDQPCTTDHSLRERYYRKLGVHFLKMRKMEYEHEGCCRMCLRRDSEPVQCSVCASRKPTRLRCGACEPAVHSLTPRSECRNLIRLLMVERS